MRGTLTILRLDIIMDRQEQHMLVCDGDRSGNCKLRPPPPRTYRE